MPFFCPLYPLWQPTNEALCSWKLCSNCSAAACWILFQKMDKGRQSSAKHLNCRSCVKVWAAMHERQRRLRVKRKVCCLPMRKVGLKQTYPAATSQCWQAARREWEKNKCSPSCSFQENKASRSSWVCLKLKNVYSVEHSEPKTYIIPGITKTTGVEKKWGGRK